MDAQCLGNLQLRAALAPSAAGWTGDANGNLAAARTAAVHEEARRGTRGAATQLPHLEQIQRSFGRHDVEHVQAHVGGDASDATRAMGAHAFAAGDHVAFHGAPDLSTAAHEAAHVVQQRAGVHLKGGVGTPGDVYEQHADRVASLVVAGRSAEAVLDEHAGGSGTGVQHTCAQCGAESTCACSVQKQEAPPGFVPEPPGAAPATPTAASTAQAKTFSNGRTFSSDAEFTRRKLLEMWVALGREEVQKFAENCTEQDPEAVEFLDRTNPGRKTWTYPNNTPPPAPMVSPVYSNPPPTPASVEKSGLRGRLDIYATIETQYKRLDRERKKFETTFQSTATQRLALILEASVVEVKKEQARYGLDAEGKKHGTSGTAEVQMDLAEMAKSARELARLKRAVDREFALETAAALPGLFTPAFGLGAGAKYPTSNGPSGIGRRLIHQRAYDQARLTACRRWPVLAGFEPRDIGQAPTGWDTLATDATGDKAGAKQLAAMATDIEGKLEHIQTVKDSLGDGSLIWELPIIKNGTRLVMGIAPGSIEYRWLADHEAVLKANAELREKILFGITIALVAITLIPSGGSSALALAGAGATVGLAGVSGYQLVHEVQQYTLDVAQSDTAYSTALRISMAEPDLAKVATAAVAAGLDAWGVAHAFRTIKGLYRAAMLKQAGAVEKLTAHGEQLRRGLGQELANQVSKTREVAGDAIKTRDVFEADRLGDLMKVAGGHEGAFTGSGKLFRCSPLCAEARYLYDDILSSRPDLLAELNRLEGGVIDLAQVAARKPAANLLLNKLQTISEIRALPDNLLRDLLEAASKTPLIRELEQEAVYRFGSVQGASKVPLLGKAAEAPALKSVDPGAWMAPENFKAFDGVNPTFGKGATFGYNLVEETYKGRKIWVVEQTITGGKWYSVKTLSSPKVTQALIKENVELSLKKAFDEAMNKAASVRDPTPVHGAATYLRVIKGGPAEAIEIVIQIPIQSSRNAAAELAQAQAWADTAMKSWGGLGDLPPTKVVVLKRPSQ
ncbi:MAG: DUF4157 domain-containing protein [Kofleriaceae bacterium]